MKSLCLSFNEDLLTVTVDGQETIYKVCTDCTTETECVDCQKEETTECVDCETEEPECTDCQTAETSETCPDGKCETCVNVLDGMTSAEILAWKEATAKAVFEKQTETINDPDTGTFAAVSMFINTEAAVEGLKPVCTQASVKNCNGGDEVCFSCMESCLSALGLCKTLHFESVSGLTVDSLKSLLGTYQRGGILIHATAPNGHSHSVIVTMYANGEFWVSDALSGANPDTRFVTFMNSNMRCPIRYDWEHTVEGVLKCVDTVGYFN